jgi:hypothetical protein
MAKDLWRFVDDRIEKRGREESPGDACAPHDLGQVSEPDVSFAVYHAIHAVQERAPDLEYGSVKGRRRHMQDDCRGTKVGVSRVSDQPHKYITLAMLAHAFLAVAARTARHPPGTAPPSQNSSAWTAEERI